ncbi:hypothetical protein LTR85_002375 [Meristemomyces frigidus]|nr:hypothetical protein LTR85_002375 [Meristemomyces frigidus]
MHSTQRSAGQPHSPLLALPPELRNHIWHYAVTLDESVGPQHKLELSRSNHLLNESEKQHVRRLSREPAITQVNRQVRAETLSCFYSQNTFGVRHVSGGDLLAVVQWLAIVGENTKYIKRIIINGMMNDRKSTAKSGQVDVAYRITLVDIEAAPLACVTYAISADVTYASRIAENCRILVQGFLDATKVAWLDVGEWELVIGYVFDFLDHEKGLENPSTCAKSPSRD